MSQVANVLNIGYLNKCENVVGLALLSSEVRLVRQVFVSSLNNYTVADNITVECSISLGPDSSVLQ